MKRIAFIGAGNLATNLALAIHHLDYNIVQVYSRTSESATSLASLVNAEAITSIKDVVVDADLYIFSVKDAVLETLLSEMPLTKGIWIHTAGSISISIFKKFTARYGVLYPLQTFSKQRTIELINVPLFIEASDRDTFKELNELSLKLSSNVCELESSKRAYLHLTAIFACNFANNLYSISKEILDKEGIAFNALIPLIQETTAKIGDMSPQEAQTGPAVRFDENVINKHLALIDNPMDKEIYSLMSKSIYERNKNKKII